MAALRSSDLIVHAGDVGSPAILDEPRTVAPTRQLGRRDYVDLDAGA